MKLISKSNKNGTICSIANLKNEAKLFLSSAVCQRLCVQKRDNIQRCVLLNYSPLRLLIGFTFMKSHIPEIS